MRRVACLPNRFVAVVAVDPADFRFAMEAAIAKSALACAQNKKTRRGGYPQVHRRVLQPSRVVTDLWQTSQFSGLRILALRSGRHTPRPLKSGDASRWGHLEFSCSFGSSTATCFHGGSSNSSQSVDIGQSGPQVVAGPSPPNLAAGVSAFSGYSGAWRTLGRLPALSAGVRQSSAKDHHD